jgi:hypothetical protein
MSATHSPGGNEERCSRTFRRPVQRSAANLDTLVRSP